MTSNTTSGGNRQLPSFNLSPTQREYLLRALASSSQPVNPSAATALRYAPTPSNFSPVQQTMATDPASILSQWPSFFNYGPDLSNLSAASSSFDLPFQDDSLLSSTTGDQHDQSAPRTSSDTPDSHPPNAPDNKPDKRNYSSDDEKGGSAKRREPQEKVHKKPGRKPLTTEPTTKRKAQNRAAQRAFRERKEKQLRDLETKIQELEQASSSANQENKLLRESLDKLTTELNAYKRRFSMLTQSVSTAMQPLPKPYGHSSVDYINFDFDFPKFGPDQGGSTTRAKWNGANSSPAADGDLVIKQEAKPSPSGPNPRSNGYSGLPSAGLYQAPQNSNNEPNLSSTTTFEHQYPLSTTSYATNSPASSNSNQGPALSGSSSSSCETSPKSLTQSPADIQPMTTVGEMQTASFTATGDTGASHFANIDADSLIFPPSQNFFDPQLFGNYREPQDNILARGSFDSTLFRDAFDMDFPAPYNIPLTAPLSPKMPKKDLIAQIDAVKENDEANEMRPTHCQNFRNQLRQYTELNDQDIDIDGLCADLKKKAKCSGYGPVISDEDFTSVMQKYVTPENARKLEKCAKQVAKAAQA